MALPTGVLTGTVKGDHVVDAAGELGTGTATLTPVTMLTGHSTIIVPSDVVLTVTNGVIAPKVLAANSDPGLLPLGWKYQVRLKLNGQYSAPFLIDVPADTVVDLSTAPRSEVLPEYTRLISTVNGVGPDSAGDVVLDASALLPEIVEDIAAVEQTATGAAEAASAATAAASAASTAAATATSTAGTALTAAQAALPRTEVGVTAAPSRALLYDRCQRPDGPLGTAESGVAWSATGPNPLVLKSGAITIPGTTGTGYAYARLTARPRVIGGRFRPTTTGSMTLVCNDEASFTGDVQGFGAHLVATRAGAALTYRVGNGPFVTVPGAEWSFTPALDEGTVYTMSMSIDPDASAVTVRLPQGKIGRFVYPQATTLTGATAVWEVSTSAGTPGRWEEVWAVGADLPVLPYVSADDLGDVLGTLFDPLGNLVSQRDTGFEVTIGRTPSGLPGVMLGDTVLGYPFAGGLIWLPHDVIVAGAAADRTITTSVELAAGLATKVGTSDTRLTDARTPLAHVHPQSDVTGLTTALAGKVSTTAVGAPSGVASLDSGGKVPTAQLPTVGGVTRIRRAYIKTGDVTLPNTAGGWQALSGFELQLPAAVGDSVEIAVHAMRNLNSSAYLDIAVVVGSAIVRYLATGTSTPPSEGDPGWYGVTGFPGQTGPRGFTVTSGDLDGGNVRFVLATRAAGAGTVYASNTYPFYWQARNDGPTT